MNLLSIGQVAKRTAVTIDTIRYYENLGILPKPNRNLNSGYRQYNENIVERINFIRNAKELGFSLKEIKQLFALKVKSNSTCADVKKRAEMKIADIEEKIETLQKMNKALKKLVTQCKGKGPVGDCPVIDAFSSS